MQERVSGWPQLLSLAVHEFRTPLTVVAGYLRMLLRERAGPLEPNQRRLIEEAEKSCGRLSTLIAEMGELSQLLDGRQSLSTDRADLAAILRDVGASVPAVEDQPRVIIEDGGEPLLLSGDGARLRRVVEYLVFGLRREIIDGSDLVVNASTRLRNSGRVAWVAFGTPPVARELSAAAPDALGPFDEWRGGCGLSLPLGRLIVEMHGGRLFALPGERERASGVLELPLA